MNGNIIKSFLIGLGFEVDDSSLSKFNKAITSATQKVAAMYAGIQAATAGVFYGISKISEGFESLGYEFRIIAPAINKALVLRREMLKAYSAAGINITKVVRSAVMLNMSIAKTKFALEAIYKSVGSRFFELLTKQSDIFRKRLYDNMPRIQAALEGMVKFLFKAFEGTVQLGERLWSILGRVYDFFAMLDEKTNGWSTAIIAAIAAWKLLNLSFLATPLGLVLSLGAALLALWDDFKTFKEGGQSLIDWSSNTTKAFVALGAALAGIAAAIYAVNIAMKAYAAVQGIVNAVMLLNPIGLTIAGIAALIGLLAIVIAKWDVIKQGFASFFGGIGGKILDFVGGASNISANIQNNPATSSSNMPLIGGASANQTNQNVNQQTSIVVNGAADANSVGKNVAGQQSRVNFDMVRNLKGATQ